MLAQAVSGDTWGISGPAFLGLYAALAAGGVLLALLFRHRAVRGTSAARASVSVPPADAAYLAGGANQAVAASLAGLNAGGAVGHQAGDLAVTGPLPADASALDHAVYRAVSDGARSQWRMRNHLDVSSELDRIRRRLLEGGLLVTPENRRRIRYAAGWLLPALAIGVARVVAGVSNDRPVGYLIVMLAVTVIVGLVLARGSAEVATTAGRRVLARMRSANRHLRSEHSPATAAYGMTAAATAVALYGAASVWHANPGFASAAGLAPPTTGAGGYTGDSGGSSSCGGGGGFGGGCGGGGGGGGCGG